MITVKRDGQTYGPYTVDELRQHVTDGFVVFDDLGQSEGTVAWVRVGTLLEEISSTESRLDMSMAGANRLPMASTTPPREKSGNEKFKVPAAVVTALVRYGLGEGALIAFLWLAYDQFSYGPIFRPLYVLGIVLLLSRIVIRHARGLVLDTSRNLLSSAYWKKYSVLGLVFLAMSVGYVVLAATQQDAYKLRAASFISDALNSFSPLFLVIRDRTMFGNSRQDLNDALGQTNSDLDKAFYEAFHSSSVPPHMFRSYQCYRRAYYDLFALTNAIGVANERRISVQQNNDFMDSLQAMGVRLTYCGDRDMADQGLFNIGRYFGAEIGLIMIKRDGKTFGPYTPQEVKEYVAAGRIDPNDDAREGRSGSWNNVRRLMADPKGLFNRQLRD